MKIQFIGTGNMDSNLFNACILINDCILIDTPPGLCKNLLKLKFNIENIKVILITHQHIDHYFDLPILIRDLSNRNIKEVSIMANKTIIDNFQNLMEMAFPDVYQEILDPIQICFFPLKEYFNYSLLDFKIQSIPVIHGNLNSCFGFILENSKTSLGYSGDASYTKEIDYLCTYSNHIILDTTNINGNTDHMGIDDICGLCQKYNSKNIYTNHMSASVKNYHFKNPKNLIIPNDYDIFKI